LHWDTDLNDQGLFPRGTENRWPSHAHIAYDAEAARYRWVFLRPEQESWTLDQATSALAAADSITDALAYIWKHAGRENVFGVVYDDAQQANFGLPFQRAMDPANPYRVEELRSTRTDSLAALDKDPNNLWVNLLWADLARSVGDYRVAVSEWFEVYFRVLALNRK
jgi:hypothetical protein